MILRQISAFQILFPSSCMTRVAVSIIWIFSPWFLRWSKLDSFSSTGGSTILMPMLLMLLVPPFWPVGRSWTREPYPSAKVNVWRSSNVWRTRWHRQLGHQRTTKRCTVSHLGMSQCPIQNWWPDLMSLLRKGTLLSDFVCEPRKPRAENHASSVWGFRPLTSCWV